MGERPWLTSYARGVPASLAPDPRGCLFDLLTNAARRYPEAPAIAFFRRYLSYRQLLAEVEQFSAALTTLGVTRGDRVGLILPNCPQYVIAYYAALRLGALVVGNNPLYTERELRHQLADAGVSVCVALDDLYPKISQIQDAVGLREVVLTRITDYMPFPTRLLARLALTVQASRSGRRWRPVPRDTGVRRWTTLVKHAGPIPPMAHIGPDDVAGLIYTGGTTGLSKGAMLTHGNLLVNVRQCAAWFAGVEEGREAIMCVLPFFHCYGMTVGMNVGVSLGAKLILVPRFDVRQTLRLVQRERPSLFPGVPRVYMALNESLEAPRFDLSSIRACLSGAAPLPLAVVEKFERLTGGQGRLVEGYGMTETSPVTHANPLRGTRKAGSIGLPLPDTDACIVDPDDWTRVLPPGQDGELAVTGPQVMQGYWNHPEETQAAVREGPDGRRWILTGDIAMMDNEGFFFIRDRKKDMINVSGFKVFPAEVEQVLYRHPKVHKVCVAGVPSAKTGEAVKAYIVLRPGETAAVEEIIAYCRDRRSGLTGYRVPELVEFRSSLPETLVGKVLRRELQREERAGATASVGGPEPASAGGDLAAGHEPAGRRR
jgi:long-chain acyl-CoA synthetase